MSTIRGEVHFSPANPHSGNATHKKGTVVFKVFFGDVAITLGEQLLVPPSTFKSSDGIIDPVLNERIDWGWFILSQIAFGMVAGWIVSRDSRVPTGQSLPVSIRMGLETPGLHVEQKEDNDR